MQMKITEKRVEAALLADMGELDIGNVVRDRFALGCNLPHFRCGDIEELGARIYEAADQPWAGDAVDLRPLARDPARRGVTRLPEKRAADFAPGFDAACQVTGAERFGDALAYLVAVHAVHDHLS